MEAEKLTKQMIEFQKTVFNNTFEIVMAVQDQSEEISRSWCEKNSILPDQSKKVMLEWGHIIKQSLKEYKKAINLGFETIETGLKFSKTFSQFKPVSFAETVMENPQPEKAEPVEGQQQ
jgi:hypothetical protein